VKSITLTQYTKCSYVLPPSGGKNGRVTKNKLEKKKMMTMGFGALKGGFHLHDW
jgi:hypothetical protein